MGDEGPMWAPHDASQRNAPEMHLKGDAMSTRMEIVELVFKVGRCLCTIVGSEYSLLTHFKENMRILETKMQELTGKKDDIRRELERAEMQQGMKTKSEVLAWLNQVEHLKNEVNGMEKELREKRGCLHSFCCFCSRLKVAKDIEGKIKKAVEFLEKSQFSDGLSIRVLDTGKTLPTTDMIGQTTILKMIWDSLEDTKTQKIGVCGMGGVGKTTIMKNINNCLKESRLFDHVIWVTVSRSSSLEKLQSDIAKEIGMDLPEDDNEQSRSSELYAALTRKKFVLILDDMWRAFPFEEVGIPEPNKDNNCKVIITTRSISVCRQMETQKIIKVDVLSEEEAWELFKNKVGGDTVLSSKLKDIAKLVAEECGGLPLALITVGQALRHVDEIRVWRNALTELKGSTDEIEGMEDKVFARLRFSYTHLKTEKLRACFLYCALYPEDYEIPTMDLVKHWIYEGLINEVGNSEKEIDKGYARLNELKSACMLEGFVDRYAVDCVKMHDLMRDMAINITRTSPRFMVRAGIGLKEVRMVEWMEDVEKVSLMNNNIQELSGAPKCPTLCTLLLQQNRRLKNVSPSFFEHMHSLRVLDLSHTRINCLPQSISNLENLHALLLHYCYDLKTMPPLTKLKSLRFLDLYYTGIEGLPQGMEELVNLKHLNLSRTFCLNMFPLGVLRNLSLLEDLFMYHSKYRWSSNSLLVEGGGNVEEIVESTHLVNLHVHFMDLSSFSDYVNSKHWQVLQSFHFVVGQIADLLPLHTSERKHTIEIGGCNIINCEKSLALPYNTRHLSIENCNDIVGLSELQCLLHLNDLKECNVFRCSAVEYITVAEKNALATLETLNLWQLPKLTAICKGVVQCGPLKCLKILRVDGCHSLKSLFSVELLHHLQNIEEIRVENCMMEEMIVGVEETANLERLRRLELEHLPNLTSFFSGAFVCNSLQTIYVMDCPKLKNIPSFTKSSPLALKDIRGNKKWWNKLQWNEPNTKIFFERFFKEEEDSDGNGDDDDDEIQSID